MRRDRYRSIDRSASSFDTSRARQSMTIGRRALDREARARDAMDAMDARSIVRAIVRDPSRSVDVERPRKRRWRAFGHFKVVSETARKFKRALFRAFFGEGLEEKRRPPAEAETRAEAGRRETWKCVDAWG